MTDYEGFAIKAMDIAHEQNVDFTDPDAVKPIAKAVAEEYVLDEEKLIEAVRQRAAETEWIGNIYGDDPEAVTETSVLLEQAREWVKER
jgi:23S rRNA A1618 N6-methylase RlmF